MPESTLLHELVHVGADRAGAAPALKAGHATLGYGELDAAVRACASGLLALGLPRAGRVGIYLEKRVETVVASFGAPAAGGVFVPMNPLLKAEQVGFIARDCDVRVLVTSPERLATLGPVLADCPALCHVVVTGAAHNESADRLGLPAHVGVLGWSELLQGVAKAGHRVVDTDMVAILYTSGSTGQPKGVVLSHRNMVAGAKSVAGYLDNGPQDTLLAALPLSFDAGFSQLTTAFHAGARVVLLNYLLPRDVLKALENERVTGLTAVPPLYIQLAALPWPAAIAAHLRYFANTGGHMPRETLMRLREHVPRARPFLMYGLTEAFRSTYLPPEEVDRRPDSIGRAIPNAEILVLREDGSECAPDEAGGRESGLQLPEHAVYSGDTVRRDAEGYLYFIGRRDEMIKTSGYRVSPNEVEEMLYASQLVGECVAFGSAHATLGQAIHVIASAPDGTAAIDLAALQADCRRRMPAYMVPASFTGAAGPLPRNPNGKIDRKLLATGWHERQPTSVPASRPVVPAQHAQAAAR